MVRYFLFFGFEKIFACVRLDYADSVAALSLNTLTRYLCIRQQRGLDYDVIVDHSTKNPRSRKKRLCITVPDLVGPGGCKGPQKRRRLA